MYPFLQYIVSSSMEKCYYSIGEISEELNVPQTTLRFWESQFDDMPGFLCRKNEKGTRRYSKQNLQNCRTLLYLLKEKRMTIEGAKKVIKAGSISNGISTVGESVDNMSVVQRLIAVRDELQGMIDVYDDIIKGKSNNSDPII